MMLHLKILSKKPNIRALVGKEIASDQEEMKFITGVVLNQKTDNADFSNMDLKTVTEIKPSKSKLEDLIFAIKVAKHVKSNAIVIAKNQMTLVLALDR
ncbi:MAG: hypothetical protein Ct9H90mP19_1090 [Gammaproteobacteria bacterium]|nr:MAG: hypothetical protein Ct9H90mP19_1090 [Gammaproteobacteria bacterium]